MLTNRREVKLLDFGIAKLSGRTALTRTGTTVGTVAYMAPEQITGRGTDERSDVWSLGVVLYEMLAGRPPFTGEHEVAILRAIADLQPTPLHTLRPDIPPAIQPIVDKALQKEARNRYAIAADFLRDLEALRAPTTPLTSARTAIAEPERRASVRRRLAIIAIALIAVALGGWFAVSGRRRFARPGRHSARLPPSSRSSASRTPSCCCGKSNRGWDRTPSS